MQSAFTVAVTYFATVIQQMLTESSFRHTVDDNNFVFHQDSVLVDYVFNAVQLLERATFNFTSFDYGSPLKTQR